MKTHFYNTAHCSPDFYSAENYSSARTIESSNTIVSKPKIFYIHGNDTNKLKQKAENYLTREEALSKFSQIINIGNRDDGFNPLRLKSAFAEHLTPDDHYVNIIINAHGGPFEYNENFYFLLDTFKDSYQHSILGVKLFELIKEATAGMPLKILVQSCHSNLLQKDLAYLPLSSTLITMANDDRAFYNEDSSSSITNLLLDAVFNESCGFKLEKLLLPLCLSQRLAQNNPIIGLKGKAGDLSINVGEFINSLTDDYPLAIKLFELKNIPAEYVSDLMNGLQFNSLSEYIIPKEFYQQVNSLISNNRYDDLEQMMSHGINKYFYTQNLINKTPEFVNILKQRVEMLKEISVNNKRLEIAQRKIDLIRQQEKDFEKFEDDIFEKCKLLLENFKSLSKEEEALDSQSNELLLFANESYHAQIMEFKKREKEVTVDITGSEDLLSIIPQLVKCLKANLEFLQRYQKHVDDSLELYQKSLSDNVLLDFYAIPNFSILLTIGANKAINYIDCIQVYNPNFSPYTPQQDSQLSGQFLELNIE